MIMNKVASLVLVCFFASTVLVAFQNCSVSPQEISTSQKNSDGSASSTSASWSYDVGQRKWSKETYTTNSSYLVPGDYKLYVKDNQGKVSVAQLSSSHGGKLAVVSVCPGDIETANKDSGCFRAGAETSNVPYAINNPTPLKPTIYCNLQPNTQYYFNVIPRYTSSGSSNCSNSSDCGFSFIGN